MAVKTTILKNGPLMLEGDVTLVDSNGGEFSLTEGKNIFLCRCGHSANKPFCDGSHKANEFQSEVTAPAP